MILNRFLIGRNRVMTLFIFRVTVIDGFVFRYIPDLISFVIVRKVNKRLMSLNSLQVEKLSSLLEQRRSPLFYRCACFFNSRNSFLSKIFSFITCHQKRRSSWRKRRDNIVSVNHSVHIQFFIHILSEFFISKSGFSECINSCDILIIRKLSCGKYS